MNPTTGVGVIANQITRAILSQTMIQLVHLGLTQFRGMGPTPMISQPFDALLSIFVAPFHQAALIGPGDVEDLSGSIALHVHPHRLIARPRGGIFRFPIPLFQLLS